MAGASDRVSDLFRALSNEHRRQVLFALQDCDPGKMLSVPEDLPFEAVDPDSLRTQLYHVHLPYLAERDLVKWERETGRVGRGPDFDAARPILESIRAELDVRPPETA
jgi:hypothetical protein